MRWSALRSIVFPIWCLGCGTADTVLCATCARCSPVQVPIDGPPVGALGEYGGPLREAILRLKLGERRAADALAALLSPHLVGAPALVPVPTTRRRRAERGFDQSTLIAHLAGARASVPIAEVLEKIPGQSQQGQSRNARLAVRRRYRIRRRVVLPRAAILIDDVVTTGATLADASMALEAAGMSVLGAWAVAWTPPGDSHRVSV